MIDLSFRAYRTNPLAHRLIETRVNFVLGNGISLTSPNPEVLTLIAAWWNDPYNAWPRKIAQRLRDLYIYGEWLHTPTVNTNTHAVFIRDLQPSVIERVLQDVDNHSEVDSVILKETRSIITGEINRDVKFPTIRRRLDIATATLLPYSGTFFFNGINRTSDSGRGVGDLFPLIDYIDIYDDVVFSRAEKITTMSHVYWDLTLEGMSEQQMRTFLANETNLPPAPGTVWAHNPQAKLESVVPDLKSDDHVNDSRALKSHIISSDGWPGTWFDDPGSAGRAVGAEMAEPALRNITQLQSTVGDFLRTMIDFVLDVAGIDVTDSDNAYSLSFNRASSRDIQRYGPALARFADFLLTVGTKIPVMNREEIRKIVVAQVNQLGLTDAPMTLELPSGLPKMSSQQKAQPPTVVAPDPTKPTKVQREQLAEANPIPDSIFLLPR